MSPKKPYISFLSLPADCDAYKMIKSNDVFPSVLKASKKNKRYDDCCD